MTRTSRRACQRLFCCVLPDAARVQEGVRGSAPMCPATEFALPTFNLFPCSRLCSPCPTSGVYIEALLAFVRACACRARQQGRPPHQHRGPPIRDYISFLFCYLPQAVQNIVSFFFFSRPLSPVGHTPAVYMWIVLPLLCVPLCSPRSSLQRLGACSSAPHQECRRATTVLMTRQPAPVPRRGRDCARLFSILFSHFCLSSCLRWRLR